MNTVNLDQLSIYSRLLAEEAVNRGYTLYSITQHKSKTPLILAEKGNKKTLLHETVTHLNSRLGHRIADNKISTDAILRHNKIPTPNTLVMDRDKQITNTEISFLEANKPIVVKPSSDTHGNGITTNITDITELAKAIEYANKKSKSKNLLLQQQVSGNEYRFLVLGGNVIAVTHRRPPLVIGDGKSTVEELIKNKINNSDRGNKNIPVTSKLNIEEVSYFIGLDNLNSVPAANEEIALINTSNISKGGEPIDCTDIASKELKSLATKVAKACFLDFAGVDVITKSITNGNDSDSYILEINAYPGIGMHHFPVSGSPRNVASMIFDHLEKHLID